MTPQQRALQILGRLYEIGCPTYRDNSGSKTRDGCAICIFCDEIIEGNGRHAANCEWLEVETIVNEDARSRL